MAKGVPTQEMNDHYLACEGRTRQAELLAEAAREHVARRLTAHHLGFEWVRYAVSALAGRIARFPAREVAGELMDP